MTDKKKFLLIYPLTVGEVPNVLAVVASILKEGGFEVKAAVNTFKKPLGNDDYIRIAKEWGATHVGISLYTLQVLRSYELIQMMKDIGMHVVLGGPHPSSEPVEGIEAGADIVVRGEGEETLRELCKYWHGKEFETSNKERQMLTPENVIKANEIFAKDRIWIGRKSKKLNVPLNVEGQENYEEDPLSKIQSITYRDKNTDKIISTPARVPVKDLDALPKAVHDIFDNEAFTVNGVVRGHHRLWTTRGCPGRCTYCNSGVMGSKLRTYSAQKTIDRIREVVETYGVSNFNFADSNFTTKKSHVFEYCNALIELRKEYPEVTWRTNSRVDLVNPEMAAAMKEAGCYMVSFGIESGDQETLDKLRKHVTVKRNHDAIWETHEAGIQVFANMMVGLPWSGPENIKNGIDFFHSVKDAVHLWQLSGAIVPLPGTAMYYDLAHEHEFTKYWLNPDEDMQAAGIQTWQNSVNPYQTSTFFQRHLFDDNFIATGKFFKYSREQQDWLKKLMMLYGKHNLGKIYKDQPIKKKWFEILGELSYFAYHNIDKDLEKKVIGGWMSRKDAQEESRWQRLGLRDRMASKEERGDESIKDSIKPSAGFKIDPIRGVIRASEGPMMGDGNKNVEIVVPSHMQPRNTQ